MQYKSHEIKQNSYVFRVTDTTFRYAYTCSVSIRRVTVFIIYLPYLLLLSRPRDTRYVKHVARDCIPDTDTPIDEYNT